MTNITEYYLLHHLESVLILLLIFVVAYTIAKTSILRRLYLPVALVAGIIILAVGPQVLGRWHPELALPADFYTTWAPLPGVLINIVFACLFLGHPALKLRQMWSLSGRQIAFGQMVAWGQYLVGGLVALLLLIPLFGDTPLVASLLEISFEGGHGTVAGLTPVFNDLGFHDGAAMANGLATLSLVSALIIGIILINWGHRRGHAEKTQPLIHREKQRFYHYTIIHRIHLQYKEMHDRRLTVRKLVRHAFLVMLSLGLGFGIRAILIAIEDATWGQAGVKVFGYVPAFSICLFGGLIVNKLCYRLGVRISMTANSLISTLSLGILIMTAVGTMSLEFFRQPNLAASFWILFVAGAIWILAAVLILARRIFTRYWFHNAMISFGQAMGMTATGLLFAQMLDPKNRTGAVEAFGYKQMLFEPLMGGGLVTAMSMPLILLLGLPLFTLICGVIAVGWFLAGIFYFRRLSFE
ncbi:MAG: sodium:glutamate symporter [Candidatus Nomurabacteria bacterium]|jgi:ESS family glutamate:Na+ symporter|nr:sodium:glutamate symporter [Candidatus Nomurabacteria bacterium]